MILRNFGCLSWQWQNYCSFCTHQKLECGTLHSLMTMWTILDTSLLYLENDDIRKRPFKIYEVFKQGNFIMQLSESSMEPDKVIEMTINKDITALGGQTGFSTNTRAIMKWTHNAWYGAELRKCLHAYVTNGI